MGEYFTTLDAMTPRRDGCSPAASEATPAPASSVRLDPMWSRLEDTILRALLPFAEARAAVVIALDSMQPVNSS